MFQQMSTNKNHRHSRGGKNKESRLSAWSKLSPALRFVLTFSVSLLVLGSAYSVLTARYDDLEWLLNLTASIAGGIASLFSDSVSFSGHFISCHGFSVEIIDECTGLLEMVIYCAAVISFSTSFRKKLIGIAAGVPAVYLFNILRIILLLVAGASSQELFRFMHLYFWQVTLVLMIGTIWLCWLRFVVFREEKGTVEVPA